MTEQNQPKSIEARARTVRELLDKAKYTIDFYQREYAWEERQVRELVDDLTGKFLDHYDSGHARPQVEHYGHYFLGSVVLSHKRGQRFIVDGQQRLTTLTLLLIELYHRQGERADGVNVRNLVFSEKYGHKSFNLDVPDREPIMRALMDGQDAQFDVSEATPSVVNIQARAAKFQCRPGFYAANSAYVGAALLRGFQGHGSAQNRAGGRLRRYLAGAPHLVFSHHQLLLGQVHDISAHQGVARPGYQRPRGLPAGGIGCSEGEFRERPAVSAARAKLSPGSPHPCSPDLDGEKPPVYEPIATIDEEEAEAEAGNRPDRYEARLAFWTKLLDHAKTQSDLHARISPGKYHWAGARRHGVWWNYWVTMAETRVTIYIDGPDAAANKTVFDALHDGHRDEIESAFGGPLEWQRLDERRACWIGTKLEGGWVDESTWDDVIKKAVDAMTRLYAAASPCLDQ
ncbi:hypothetical protein Thiowin_04323 [Thiorhodovibrio winogradskyi]|uniref:DUF4268 domain-containing protein n=1 Tax=Thiorhodovibrio winogradskyi TaxID=77007 RepID=A0ABZ0SFX9_9GAMM|nr:DUF4268 domain-containing protein [Thiorhodovibrio winogradskyi]